MDITPQVPQPSNLPISHPADTHLPNRFRKKILINSFFVTSILYIFRLTPDPLQSQRGVGGGSNFHLGAYDYDEEEDEELERLFGSGGGSGDRRGRAR